MSIFDVVKQYQPMKWQVTEERQFSATEVAQVENAYVRESDYGLSVCFILTSGKKSYIPVSQNTAAAVGQVVDLTKAKLLRLSREGEEDIFRVEF